MLGCLPPLTDHASVSGLINMVVLSNNLVASLDGTAAARLSVSMDSVANSSGRENLPGKPQLNGVQLWRYS